MASDVKSKPPAWTDEERSKPPGYSSVSWLQEPAISIGAPVRVAGTSYYQDELELIAGGRNFAGTGRRVLTARLVREEDNLHDGNAVRVDAAGILVGHPRSCPNPTGTVTGGNHKSHCASSPGS